ncbi:MAG: nucleoside triphosphate pyrophosphohydrolase [Treponemataceae bacterium]|nr:nucleoside triphosphate pyrophosphohydrolase [Treponemataceae bacterium]
MKDITNDKDYENSDAGESFDRLQKIVKKLRAPDGCPWDREQTPESMRQPLIEECYEAVDAINQQDPSHVCEELGDVYLNATLIANIYEERGDFDLAKSLNQVCSKIVRRHPHVWPPLQSEENGPKVKNTEEVLNQWEEIKQKVEGRKKKCLLDEVSYGLPPLLRAYKIQKKAAKRGFDWDNLEDVWAKVEEEMTELKEAISKKDRDNMEEEMGDLLFSIVNLSRKLEIDPEIALSRTNQKFRDRYAYVEEKMAENNEPMEAGNLEKMDYFWNQAKKLR